MSFNIFGDISRLANHKTLMNWMKYFMENTKYFTDTMRVPKTVFRFLGVRTMRDALLQSKDLEKWSYLLRRIVLKVRDPWKVRVKRQTADESFNFEFPIIFLGNSKGLFCLLRIWRKNWTFHLAAIIIVCRRAFSTSVKKNTPDYERSFRSTKSAACQSQGPSWGAYATPTFWKSPLKSAKMG